MREILVMAFLIALTAVNFLTFILFAADKGFARKGKWRVPEKVLLGFSCAGGALGGILGMYVCRHKTRKPAFKFGLPLMLALWTGALIWILTKGIMLCHR